MRDTTREAPAGGEGPRGCGLVRSGASGRRARTRGVGRALTILFLLGALALLVVPDSFVDGDVLLGYAISPTASGHSPLANLSALTTQAGSRCTGRTPLTTAVGSLLGTTSTRGSIHITLPRACRAHRQIFPAALLFPAGKQFHGQIGLVASSWPGNIGSLIACIAQSNHGCLSRQITVTSRSTVPISTNAPILITGNSYGPLLETIFTRAGTTTVDLALAISQYSPTGATASLVQQDWIEVVIVQK
jgi:hypothetical protein